MTRLYRFSESNSVYNLMCKNGGYVNPAFVELLLPLEWLACPVTPNYMQILLPRPMVSRQQSTIQDCMNAAESTILLIEDRLRDVTVPCSYHPSAAMIGTVHAPQEPATAAAAAASGASLDLVTQLVVVVMIQLEQQLEGLI
jgi:hypothetical protein